MRFCFVFNLDAGELERQACLLAASLRRHASGEPELVAAVPRSKGSPDGFLQAETLRLLDRLDVRIVAIDNPIDESYPIGYKLSCLDVATDADQIVFLDSDIIACRDFDPPGLFPAGFAAAPENWDTYPQNDALWRLIYRTCGQKAPDWRMEATHTGQVIWPYYNAGVVSVPANSGFGALWSRFAKRIDRNPLIPRKRPWLDQIALPVAAQAAGLPRSALSREAHFRTPKERIRGTVPALCHYHRPFTLRREPLLKHTAAVLGAQHPELATLWAGSKEWALASGPYVTQRPTDATEPVPAQPDLILSGMPRSGTSYLCTLLHRLQDTVVLNEPPEVTKGLNLDRYPEWLAVKYQKWRTNILHGVGVPNKIRDGQLIEDTAKGDVQDHYRPTVRRPDFLLGTKNNVAYLARIRQIRQIMPDTPIVAAIRDPVDTLASWQKSFRHLENGDFRRLRVCNPKDPWFSPQERRQMAEIHAQKDPLTRQALLWCSLARIMHNERHNMMIVRYEELVRDPEAHLRRILDAVPGAPPYHPLEAIDASEPRSKRDTLSQEQIDTIRQICGPMAARFGYSC